MWVHQPRRFRKLSSLIQHDHRPSRVSRVIVWITASAVILGLAVTSGLIPAASAQTTASTVGQWSSVQTWPTVAVHTSMLPTGKVMYYSYSDDSHLWDPAANSSRATADLAGYNIFCTGHTLMADGRVIVAGGHIENGVGEPRAIVYDPPTDKWTNLPNMNAGRWYPTNTTLANGDVLVVAGSITGSQQNDLPQVWQPGSGSWRNLSNARLVQDYYPYMYVAPNGKVLDAGPSTTTRYLDTSGSGTWTTLASSKFGHRSYGSSVLYDDGKVLIAGGGDPPTATTEVIDLNSDSPAWRSVSSMANPRRQMNATLLPDGKVLVTGGSSGPGHNNASYPVYTAEMWDPSTESWSPMSSNRRYRGYHSTALLLPDGRVLSAGGDNEPNAEIYSPPYLFKGTRPTITSAPASISLGETFAVKTPDASSITQVTSIRLSSVTHAFDMNQRINRLSFSRTADGLNVTAPSSGNLAPPGHYMLFILNSSGVPSVAKIVQVGASIGGPSPTPPPAAPSALTATAASSSQINLAWTDNATDESGFKIERSTDGTTFTQVATVAANVATFSNTGLSVSTTYYYRVRAYNAGGDSAYSNTANATTPAAPKTPAAPSGLTATVASSSRIDLAWTDNSADETGFRIERSTDGSSFTRIATVGANVTTYSNTGLSSGTRYYYRVRAYNAAGNSGYSNTASASTSRPAAPSGLTATAVSSSQINLAWTDRSNDEQGFRIYRSTDGSSFTQIATVGANVTTYSNTGLSASRKYYYRVRAYNVVGNSSNSNTASATTLQ